MWTTGTLISKEKDSTNGNVIGVLEFTGDAGEIPQQRRIPGNDLSADFLAGFVKQTLAVLNTQTASFEALSVGPIEPKDPPQTFGRAVQKYAALKQLVDLGIVAPDAKEVVEALAAAKELYVPPL